MPDDRTAGDPTQEASAASPPEPLAGASGAGRRGPSPFLIGLAFVVLFGGGYALTQYITYSGPKIAWLYDLEQARAESGRSRKRIFLMLHEPGCKITARNERELFSTRFARERLAQMIPCRVELRPGDPLRDQFQFTGPPLMITLDANGMPLGRSEGRIDEREFRTNHHPK